MNSLNTLLSTFLIIYFVINSPTQMSSEKSVFSQMCKATVLLICPYIDARKGLKNNRM